MIVTTTIIIIIEDYNELFMQCPVLWEVPALTQYNNNDNNNNRHL